MAAAVFGTVKDGVLIGLLRAPGLMQWIEQMEPDKLVPFIIMMSVAAKLFDYGTRTLAALVANDNTWFKLVNLCVRTLDSFNRVIQVMIGMLLVRAVMHYTSQDLVIGAILATALGLVVDAFIEYLSPKA